MEQPEFEPLERRHQGKRLEGPPLVEREEFVFDPDRPPHLKRKFMEKYHIAQNDLTPRQLHDIKAHVEICSKCAQELESEKPLF